MVSRNVSEGVKPRYLLSAMGQGLVRPEASIAACVTRRVCSGTPGSQAAAGHPTDCIGTWDSRSACMAQQAQEARTGRGAAAVGPTHSRGVTGVTPGGANTLTRRGRQFVEESTGSQAHTQRW